MKNIVFLTFLPVLILSTACTKKKTEEKEKGFRVSNGTTMRPDSIEQGLGTDSLIFDTRPGGVLKTGLKDVRLTTVYKINIDKDSRSTFTGTDCFHKQYDYDEWDNNLMPGLEAVYGYNMVNVSYFNFSQNKQALFFDSAVLVKTIYFPSSSIDTLNGKTVSRNYFMVSVYNEDTNKDGYINPKDLRRFYLFDSNGLRQKALVSENYSVLKSEYDEQNDLMYVFARLDANQNGRREEVEPIHIFWVDLKDPNRTGRLY